MGRKGGMAVLAAVGLVLLAGCGASNPESSSARDASSVGAAAKPEGVASDSGGKAASGQPKAPVADQPTVTRAIIRTGSLTVEADDVNAKRQEAITAIIGLKGQVASENTGDDAHGNISSANLVLKVPSTSYDAAIDVLSKLGKRLQIHQESTDVTEQVVDVDSRIRTQRASLDRMRALLAKANTIGEIVSVESELTRREADLESLLAKQKNLALQTELATLNLTLTSKDTPPVVTAPDRGFVGGLKGGWHAFTATFSALATALGAVLPFAVLIALIAVPVWRYRRRLRRTATPAAPAESGPA
ncbi:DUF4349 domain-containing protein [Kribbella antibiotica]|uniref:DUF4349 domain-containing protein n=1 Tax=Kribbella antibiotica TaxID=190195 RepID=A0A4R4ZQ98_9ACTN|nr:DUF4349 domain-containing protein [Kribbella antibiotica]TDD60049.1 DUF4349 domain-containing protein [Kribbella antibiotica]